MARLGKVHVTALDVSRTFVEIAAAKARKAGVTVEFRQGDVAHIPFASDSFDLIVCQAAFKNFALPGTALAEMHRVLRAGGTAVIQDMSKDATHADIDDEVNGMELGRFSAFTTRATLEMLKRRAYSPDQLRQLAAESPFRTCQITTRGIGLEVQLKKEKDQ
jgi:ubiquinone/menaquinone biosynthesis C-methylase UbiE